MRLPYEYWIKYLLLAPGVTKRSIPKIIGLYGLPEPSAAYVKSINEKLLKTKPKPFKLNTPKVRRWLRRQKVSSLMFDREAAVEARSLLGDHKVRRCLEFLLLADTPRENIPEFCLRLSGYSISLEVVKAYEHYFWNRDLLQFKEWCAFLKAYHFEAPELINSHERGYAYALWKLGYREELSADTLVKSVLHESAMRFFETGGMRNTKDTAMIAKFWSETMFKSLEELNKSGDAVQEILDELKSISIKLEKADIKDINALTGGKHTNGADNGAKK
jgi:hypothetical protein